MIYTHKPVMPGECIEALNIRAGGVYVDCTTGLGGHSEEIAKRLPVGRLICIDKDEAALAHSRKRLTPYGSAVSFARSDFRELGRVLDGLGVERADGMLLDLGVSSLQLDMPERGFSYRHEAPLDMRMDTSAAVNADTVVNDWPAEALKRILYEYGEERYAPLIAAAIVRARPIRTTTELAETVRSAMPARARREKQHPARRTFQAIRIAVNDELGALTDVLDQAVERLAPGGRIAVLTFHSLEDRIVKSRFGAWESGCVCPPDFPACVCGKKPLVRNVGRFAPSESEIAENPRAESARLRAAEKI